MTNAFHSVVLCFAAVGVGHLLAHRMVARPEIAETLEEEYTG